MVLFPANISVPSSSISQTPKLKLPCLSRYAILLDPEPEALRATVLSKSGNCLAERSAPAARMISVPAIKPLSCLTSRRTSSRRRRRRRRSSSLVTRSMLWEEGGICFLCFRNRS